MLVTYNNEIMEHAKVPFQVIIITAHTHSDDKDQPHHLMPDKGYLVTTTQVRIQHICIMIVITLMCTTYFLVVGNIQSDIYV